MDGRSGDPAAAGRAEGDRQSGRGRRRDHEVRIAKRLVRQRREGDRLVRCGDGERLPVKKLDFRVGEKGGVSVYGLGRFPVTLYYEQWTRLLDASTELRAFLEENKAAGKLKLKEK